MAASLAVYVRQGNGHHPGAAATVTTASLAEFAILVRDLSERSKRNAAAAAMWQARAEMLAGQVERLQLALEAPKPDSPEIAPQCDSEGPVVETIHHTSSEPMRARPWWAFWR
jgi:hypothetical protein